MHVSSRLACAISAATQQPSRQKTATHGRCALNQGHTHLAHRIHPHRMHTRRVRAAGGTRFIGLYLARQLVEAGHEVTLYTRGKKAITSQIADDTDAGYARFARSVKHIAGDRQVRRRQELGAARQGGLGLLRARSEHGVARRRGACTLAC